MRDFALCRVAHLFCFFGVFKNTKHRVMTIIIYIIACFLPIYALMFNESRLTLKASSGRELLSEMTEGECVKYRIVRRT